MFISRNISLLQLQQSSQNLLTLTACHIALLWMVSTVRNGAIHQPLRSIALPTDDPPSEDDSVTLRPSTAPSPVSRRRALLLLPSSSPSSDAPVPSAAPSSATSDATPYESLLTASQLRYLSALFDAAGGSLAESAFVSLFLTDPRMRVVGRPLLSRSALLHWARRIDANASGTIEWHEVAADLLVQRSRGVARDAAGRSYMPIAAAVACRAAAAADAVAAADAAADAAGGAGAGGDVTVVGGSGVRTSAGVGMAGGLRAWAAAAAASGSSSGGGDGSGGVPVGHQGAVTRIVAVGDAGVHWG